MRVHSIAAIVLMVALAIGAPLPLLCCSPQMPDMPRHTMLHPCCARTTLTVQPPAAMLEPLLIIPAVPSHPAPRIARAQSSPIAEHHIERSTYYAALDTIQLRI
ncbi:MAG: hypothetical protein JWO97_3274 [Acidobacteria bacterium]|nr:hypothetical protein [Acidobacteriota bacterium]